MPFQPEAKGHVTHWLLLYINPVWYGEAQKFQHQLSVISSQWARGVGY